MMIQLIILSLLAEAIWENLRMIWENGKFSINRLGALILSIIIAVGTKTDLFELLKLNIFIPVLGSIFTGILISRGANVVHDLLKKIQNLSENSIENSIENETDLGDDDYGL